MLLLLLTKSCYIRSILLLLSIFLSTLRVSAVSVGDLGGPYVYRFGAPNCPPFLRFKAGNISKQISLLSVKDNACTQGQISLSDSPRVSTIANFIKGESTTSFVIHASITSPIVCGSYTLDDRSSFTIFSTNSNLIVNWADVFPRVVSPIATSIGSSNYTFVNNVIYLLINNICLFTTITKQEIQKQRANECFPASAKVLLASSETSAISALKLGDYVASPTLTNPYALTRIVAWTHRDPHHVGSFVKIVMSNHSITLTPLHYLYTSSGLVVAKHVMAGMRLRLPIGWQTVTYITSTWSHGLYNVQTHSGSIVVDGVLCSTYTQAIPPLTAHALLTPIRLLSTFVFHSL